MIAEEEPSGGNPEIKPFFLLLLFLLLLLLLWYGNIDLTLFQRGYEKCLFSYFSSQKIRVNDNPRVYDDDIGVAIINICTIQRYIKKLR